MIVSYKYKIKGKCVGRRLSAHARAVNQVWNYCVETQKKIQSNRKRGQRVHWLSRFDFQTLTKNTSTDVGLSSQTIQQTSAQFVKRRDQFKKCPRFRHSDGPKRSLGWVPFTDQNRKITTDSVTYLCKTYKFFGADSRPLPSTAKGGCFVEDSKGQWWVCFHIERKEDTNHGNKEIGVDLGLKDLVTTSDGIKYENPAFYRKLEQKLKVAQRANNNKRVKSLHDRIKNQRKDYLHKLSNKLVRESSLIIVGNVKAGLGLKSLRKAAYDASWSGLREMLRYKASRHGVKYLETNEAFTTQTCSHCGRRPDGRPKGIAGLEIREWVCSSCGTSHDRDVNAAKNILNLGRGAAPPGGESLAGVVGDGKEISTKIELGKVP